ncbi:hypothetical protein Tcan_18621 [Toxocara canis]|uniref:Uncharacterized protein n=1 Tax=Toxocara canis TaxID=6265 RepID=A0A0B2UWR6_TOXCA|nr:hypothetical protein Tcan_18621 [Toxocara canis]
MDELNQSDGTSAGTSLASSSQMPSCVVSSHGNHTFNQKRSSVSRSGEMSQERSTSEEQGSLSKEPNYMLEWRKWRRAVANDSDRGQRPLKGDSWCSNGIGSSSYSS